MIETMKTVYRQGEGEIVEKKSRFIATVGLIHSEEEAVSFVESIKKKYWDARHNCWAYVLGERQEIVRCSDDGEPQGTAGRPMLDVLLGEEIHNAVVVVTRYFGGTLLGTGGLVRAYSKAVQEGLSNAVIIQRKYGVLLEVLTDYNGVGKMQYLCGQRNLPILDAQYTDVVTLKILIPKQETESVCKAITEATSGSARMREDEELYYAVLDGQVLVGENLEA